MQQQNCDEDLAGALKDACKSRLPLSHRPLGLGTAFMCPGSIPTDDEDVLIIL